MTWTLTIIGDSSISTETLAAMVVPVTDKLHDYGPAADTVEQLVCEQFHDTYPHHAICEMTWTHERETDGAQRDRDRRTEQGPCGG